MSNTYRILLAEDHTILRDGLCALLALESGIEVIGSVDNGRDAVHAAGTLRPDLVLMDISMSGMDGLVAMAEIKKRYSDVKVLALTVHKTEEYIRSALHAGANGYVLKDASREELVMAIRSVLSGKTYLSPAVSDRIVNGYLDGDRGLPVRVSIDALTVRERQILRLVAEGKRNKEIARFLCVSIKTVEKHRANLMRKLDLHNAPALVAYAFEHGFIAVDSYPRGEET